MQENSGQGWKRKQAAAYLREHPDASISEASRALGLSPRTVAYARKILVEQKILPPYKRGVLEPEGEAAAPESPSSPVEQAVSPPKKNIGGTLLDAKALEELGGMLDRIEENEDDIESQKLMLRQVKRMAFDLRLHPDTRMSAMQLWTKLRDTVTSRTLGPGKPLTRAAAIDRLVMLFEAVGPELAVEAMYKAYGITDEGKLPANDGEAARSPVGTPDAPGSGTPVPPHDGAAGPS